VLLVLVAAAAALAGRLAIERRSAIRIEPWPGLAALAESNARPSPRGRSGALVLGPAAARVSVHIFADYTCAACDRLEQRAGDSLRSLARAGLIRLYHHHAPILGRPADFAAHALACAVEAGEPWLLHAALYAIDGRERGAPPSEAILNASPRLGELPALRTCLRTPAPDAARPAIAHARRLGIHEVPTVVVDGQRVRYRSSGRLLDFITDHAIGRQRER